MSLLFRNISLIVFTCLCFGCKSRDKSSTIPNDTARKGSYAYDLEFLKKHSGGLVELTNMDSSSKILLSADYQGRVMTSTATGDTGVSFGWLNYGLIASGEWKENFNPVGGEERFWLGPEGGQYSIFFKKGDSFNISSWQVPALIDTVSYNVVQASNNEVLYEKRSSLMNYSGFVFDINILRRVRMIDKTTVEGLIGMPLDPELKFVGYQTENTIQNLGIKDWTKETGLLSIWLLGMFTPTPETFVIVPFSPVRNTGGYITDNYFGAVPANRLQVKDSVLFFLCDGRYRSKIGISPVIAKPLAAGFDFKNNVLTLVIPEVHKGAAYVNSKWELQKEPYKGDVINSYNDGPLENGEQMGPFYEIESSSPALELRAGEKRTYRQSTCHLQGDYTSLKTLVQNLLAANLDSIRAFK